MQQHTRPQHTANKTRPPSPSEAVDRFPLGWQEDDWWTLVQVCRYVKLHRTHVWKLERRGDFPKRSDRVTRNPLWRSDEVKRWLIDPIEGLDQETN
jgi:predicted DNA-binding transcriptional regulator AlpA